MNTIQISSSPIAIQQSVSSGNAFDGTAPSGDPSFDNEKDMIVYPEGNSGGLFDFKKTEPGRGHIYAVRMRVGVESGVSWELSVTSGRRDGSSGQVDDPGFDMTIASGSEPDDIEIGRQLMPNHNLIRFTTSTAPTTKSIIEFIVVDLLARENMVSL